MSVGGGGGGGVALYNNKFLMYLSEVQEILVNMMFNMGRTRLSKFKNFRAALEDQDWACAAVEGRDSLWYRQVTNRAERLMVRLENVGETSIVVLILVIRKRIDTRIDI